MSPKIQPIKTSSLMAQAFESLRDAIFTGRLLPGEHLREMHLARDLQVSQVVVREALVKLEHLGLVVRLSNRHTTVTKMSSKEIAERLAVRERLEEMAFVEAAANLTRDDVIELKRISREIARTLEKKDYFESAQADLYFHQYVWGLADNETLYHALNNVTVPLFAFLVILRRTGYESLEDLYDPHERLVAVLEGKIKSEIESAVRLHIRYSYDRFLESGISDMQVLARKIA